MKSPVPTAASQSISARHNGGLPSKRRPSITRPSFSRKANSSQTRNDRTAWRSTFATFWWGAARRPIDLVPGSANSRCREDDLDAPDRAGCRRRVHQSNGFGQGKAREIRACRPLAPSPSADANARIWTTVLWLADRYGLTIYDACYLELAQRFGDARSRPARGRPSARIVTARNLIPGTSTIGAAPIVSSRSTSQFCGDLDHLRLLRCALQWPGEADARGCPS